jgi:cytochrome c peroxidase
VFTRTFAAALLAPLLLVGCKKSEPTPAEAARATEQAVTAAAPTPAALRTKASALFGALPSVMESKTHPLTPERIALGHALYFDPRLSKGQELSCNSCHDLSAYGVDTRPEALERGTSFGHKRQFGDRNSPTVYNAALHFVQFWDGRAADVEEQAKGPILNPVEMSMGGEANVLSVLKSVPGYEAPFKAAFPGEAEPINYTNMATAIGAYERTLVTPSRFDKFLAGDDAALTSAELAGLDTFIGSGCIACHNGVGVGGGSFQKLGLLKPYPTKDEGRAKITGSEADKFVFKVPSLRNIEKTAPYFHDGSVKTLAEAVKLMALHQTAAGQLPDDKVASIVSFLGTLTGDLPLDKIAKPELPPNGPKTPGPDPS